MKNKRDGYCLAPDYVEINEEGKCANLTCSFMNRNKKGVIHMAGFKRDPKTGKVKLSSLAVYWHEVNGMSVDEIAELLKEPKDTIQKWIDDFNQRMSTKE